MLAAAAINETNTGSQWKRVVHEWLTGWFDGGSHTLGRFPGTTFPDCNVRFGQGETKEVATGVTREIRVFALPLDAMECRVEEGHLATPATRWEFWVRTARKHHAGAARADMETVTDLLKALLANGLTRFDLAQKGIHILRTFNPMEAPHRTYHQAVVTAYGYTRFEVHPDNNTP